MTNAESLRAAIGATTDDRLLAEISDLTNSEDWDTVSAFLHIDDLSESEAGWKCFRPACRRILIDSGYYFPMSKGDIENTVVSSGTVWAFKKGGVAYDTFGAINSWVYGDTDDD